MTRNLTPLEAERRLKAISLRKAGHAWESVGAQMGITQQAAQQLVKRALAATMREATADLRALEVARLDDLLLALYSLATSNDPELPLTRLQLEAQDRVLRIMERRAKLLGLDAPSKQEITGADGGPISVEAWQADRARRHQEATETTAVFGEVEPD